MKNQTDKETIRECRLSKDARWIVLSLIFIFSGNLDALQAKSFSGPSNLVVSENAIVTPITFQQSTLKGIVNDSDGTPLPGANVIVTGTTRGVTTDFDGNFSINAEVGDILEVSYIGFKTLEVPVENLEALTISLETDAASLDEVVVVGYGTQKKKDLTGSIARVKAEDFSPGTNTNAVQLLNGAAAGVNVSQISSAPGGGIKIQVRGAGSINSANDVLFVVDGLPGVDPNSLSPDDIESIDVLKDASAASIYGTRAANGVVLITTKQGRGEPQLSYSSYLGMQAIEGQLDVLGGSDYQELVNLRAGSSVYSDAEIAAAGEGTNWQDEIFRSAPIQNHQISLSGGGEKGSYYLGLNYFEQDGVVKSTSDQKYNVRLNVTSNPFDRLKISTNLNFTRQSTDEILFSNAANDFAGPINTAIQFDPSLPAGLNDNGRYFMNPNIALDNPVALVEGITDEEVSSRFYGSLTADLEVLKNVTATLRLGAELKNGRTDFYRSRVTQIGLSNGGDGGVGSSNDNPSEYTHWLAEYLLKYENTFNEKHDFSVLGGATFEEFLTRRISGSSAGFLSDVTGTNLLQSGDGELRDNVATSKTKNQLNGFLGRVTYGFDGRYLLTASIRVDGSSRFSDANKYGFFPSASLGWRVSEESFFEKVEWFNDLKFRVGYGELGNQGIGNFETRQTLVAGGNSVFGGAVSQGVVPARLPNPDLTWETTAEVNVGMDFGLFNNRISGSVDYYNRKTTDQLFVKPLPSVVGFGGVRTNFGEVVNKGLEIAVATKNLTGELKWSTNFNIAFLKNETTELPDFTEELIGGNIGTFISNYLIVREGDPLYSFYGYEIDGIFQEGDDIENSPTPNVDGYAPGMPRFVDQNGDNVIDDEDRIILGDPFQDLNFGINNTFEYKGISLSFFINGVQGIETLNANVTESLYPTNDARNSISRFYKDRWTPENPSNELPSGVNASLYGGARAINSLTVLDASFIRLKNVTLGYNFPMDNIDVLKSLRVYIAADNLVTITDFEGFDPDASATGEGIVKVNYNTYPLAKTIRLGFDVKF